ncbi:MAG: LacI family DNA-binding transcriptional regulator [Ktedonobacteraceae bacterium]|nr:LacI family DNA-binding transcriptional regulator [Ktedonobacteraceae bacterium]
MPISLAEIAARAGVSLATASRALNGKGGVKPGTRERILAIAREFNYSPSMVARGLATTRTDTIGFVVHQRHAPFDLDPFYPIIMHGVVTELAHHGYHLLLSLVNDEQLKSDEHFKPIVENRVDGIIVVGPDIPPRFILQLRQQGIPLLLVDNMMTSVAVDSVNSDDVRGGWQATEHLQQHGHRTIVALLGPAHWHSSARRGQGYSEAMAAAGLPTHLFHASDTTVETGKQLIKEALATVPDLTAVFAVNDAMALGAMQVLAQQQRKVPEDVALIGFDDTNFSALTEPSLSTIRVFKNELGRLAARRMLDILSETDNPPVQTLVATELIPRRSCGCTV